jgi:hypothetical protein
MGWPIGGSELAGELEALRDELLDYFGAISEMRMLSESQPNLASTIKIPKKPEPLVLWEKCQALGLPLYEGGLLDQPYIWIEQVAVIMDVQTVFNAVNKRGTDGSN